MSNSPETLIAVRQELALSRESLLWGTATAADTLRIYLVGGATAPTLEEARERVRRAETVESRALARRFAERVSGREGVSDVLLVTLEPELTIAVVVDDLDMQRELDLHAAFVDLARQLPDPATGDLMVLVSGLDTRPAGQSLL